MDVQIDVLEQLHVLPNVSYLAKVRNTDRHIGIMEEHANTASQAEKNEAEHAPAH